MYFPLIFEGKLQNRSTNFSRFGLKTMGNLNFQENFEIFRIKTSLENEFISHFGIKITKPFNKICAL